MRQILIGKDVASAYANGLEANGAISIQKLHAITGVANVLADTDTIATADKIRFVQGTADKNIVTPWIKGADVVKITGKAYVAPAAQVTTITFTTAATAAGDMTLKFTDVSSGYEPYTRKSYTIAVTAGMVQNDIAAAFRAAIAADLPTFISGESGATNTVVMTGNLKSATVDKIVSFSTADDIDGSNGTTAAIVATTSPFGGNGTEFQVADLEKANQGQGAGYYNRVHLPIAPDSYTAAAETYDTYAITYKDGVAGGINGVETLREVLIFVPPTGATTWIQGNAAGTLADSFEIKLNSWGASLPVAQAAVKLVP